MNRIQYAIMICTLATMKLIGAIAAGGVLFFFVREMLK